MADLEKEAIGNKTDGHPLWRRIGHHKGRCESISEMDLRQSEGLIVEINAEDHYSQVRSRCGQPPENGPDSYYTPNIEGAEIGNEDPAFQDVLEMLKQNTESEKEGETSNRLDTFGPDNQQRDGAKKLRQGASVKRILSILDKVALLQDFMRQTKKQLVGEYAWFREFYDRAVGMIQTGQHSAVSLPFAQGSLCESIRVDISQGLGFDKRPKKFARAPSIEANAVGSVNSSSELLIEELRKEIQKRENQVSVLEQRIMEDQLKHKVHAERLQKQNELLNLQLKEVIERMEHQRKILRNRHQFLPVKSQSEDQEALSQLRKELQGKQGAIAELRAELTEQYSTIQAFITCIRQLEASAAQSVSASVVAEKQMEVADLTVRLNNLQNEYGRLEDQHQTLKFRNFSTEQQNFCLLQRVESFDSEVADKVYEGRKDLLKQVKQLKDRLEQMDSDHNRMRNLLIAEREDKQRMELKYIRQAKERSLMLEATNSLGHQRKKSVTEYVEEELDSHQRSLHNSRQHNHPLFIEENNEIDVEGRQSGTLPHRQTQKSLRQTNYSREMLLLEDVTYETPKYDRNQQSKTGWQFAQKTTRYQPDLQSQHSGLNRRTNYQPIKESSLYKPSHPQPRYSRESKVSPRSMYYPTPDHSNRMREINIKPLALNQVSSRHADVCTTNRTRPQNSSVQRQPRQHRLQISSLQMQLNSLSNQLKCEISQIPQRKHK